ncbi:glycosyltransferase family 39 protein [Halosquirtibacter laminarini]|uniref:Glycosyltransferase family 39 protein n=1 Tax=Halosquirtibacter laminarini TaxID=3374600 RepID=A0AC61NF76_9BACT|nr:glycosyltransferase family 39 protein [Prolixibacteraceae bacterium]
MKRIYGVWFSMLLVSFVILITFPLELHFDEAQYWSWAERLQASYYSKPPLIAYLNYISTSILGKTEIAVRLWSWLFANLTSLLFYRWVLFLTSDKKRTLKALCLYYFFPHYWYTVIFFTTDVLLLFFYMGAILFITKISKNDRLRYWVILGIFAGLGVLSKYAMIAGLLPLSFILLSGNRFSKIHVLIFLCITLMGCIPILLWASSNDFISFKHLLGLTVSGREFSVLRSFRNLFEFLGGQLVLLGGLLFIPIFKGISKCLKEETLLFKLVLLPYLLVILMFSVLSFTRHSASHINWTLFIVCPMPLILLLGIEQIKNKQWIYLSIIFTTFSYLLLFDGLYQGDNSLLAKTVPINKVTRRLVGWNELNEKLEEVTMDSKHIVIVCSHYSIFSELCFYGSKKYDLIYYNPSCRMNQYDLWMEPTYDFYKGWDAYIISEHKSIKCYKDHFLNMDSISTFKYENQAYQGKSFYLYKVSGINFTNINKSKY